MRILVISPDFVPLADPEAFCAAKWAFALQEAGADVVVLADPVRRFADSSPAWAGLASSTLTIETSSNRNLAHRVLSSFRYQTWAWPRWIDKVVETGKQLHCEKPFDLIVARSLPWHACVAAYWTAKAIRRPWIATVNDPWQLWQFRPDRNKTPSSLDRLLVAHWLKRCLSSAKKVVFPCSRLAQYFERNGRMAPQAIVPHIGWRRSDPSTSRQFTLVHAGKIGANEATGRRSGLALLRGLAGFLSGTPDAKSDCGLVFVGPEDPATTELCHELNLSDNVKSVGTVSYEESLRFIGESSVCVLIEGHYQEGIFLPSKLVDYLAAFKPVLALSPRNGTVADFPAGCGIFRVDPDDSEGVAAHIGFLYDRFTLGDLSTLQPPESLVKQFEPQVIARHFLNIATEIIGRNPRAS